MLCIMNYDELPDDVLVEMAKCGDMNAFEQLFWRYHEKIYTFVWHRLQDHTESEDATQETFVRALEALPTLKANNTFGTWLHTIAKNICNDILRKRAREVPLSVAHDAFVEPLSSNTTNHTVEDYVWASDADTCDPEGMLARNELKMRVHEAIANLPPAQRDVVVLHHIEEMPVAEVAQILGIPIGTVLSRLARAREALRDALAQYVEEGSINCEVNRDEA